MSTAAQVTNQAYRSLKVCILSSCLFLPGRPGSNVGFSDALGICIRSGSGGEGVFQPPAPTLSLPPSLPLQLHPTLGRASCAPVNTPVLPSPHISIPGPPLCSSVSLSTKAGAELEAGWDVCGGQSPVLAAEAVVWAHSSSHAGSGAAQGRDRLVCGNVSNRYI